MNLHHGDCIEVMAGMEPESVDAIVTDPPYGLGFMGKAWDGPAIAEAARKDAATRKSVGRHSASRPGRAKARSSSAFGSAAHYAGPVAGGRPWQEWCEEWGRAAYRVAKPSAYLLAFGGTRTVHRMTCALEDAGWIIRDMLVWGYASGFPKSKASLKPAWEPIVMARKPGQLRMLAIDECRIGTTVETWPASRRQYDVSGIQPGGGTGGHTDATGDAPAGRWPANIVLTDPIFDGGIEGVVGGGETTSGVGIVGTGSGRDDFYNSGIIHSSYGDTGTYSRFFLVPKAARSDREPVLGGLPARETLIGAAGHKINPMTGRPVVDMPRQNVHPTVKPVDLMRHLVRLVTPTGGVVLDPFLGSGTTALAAEMEGFEWIGIEREAEYIAIAEARLNGTQRGLGLEVG